MLIQINVVAGGNNHAPTKEDVQKNIDAIQRAVEHKPECSDDVLLLDTQSILIAIQDNLPY